MAASEHTFHSWGYDLWFVDLEASTCLNTLSQTTHGSEFTVAKKKKLVLYGEKIFRPA